MASWLDLFLIYTAVTEFFWADEPSQILQSYRLLWRDIYVTWAGREWQKNIREYQDTVCLL